MYLKHTVHSCIVVEKEVNDKKIDQQAGGTS